MTGAWARSEAVRGEGGVGGAGCWRSQRQLLATRTPALLAAPRPLVQAWLGAAWAGRLVAYIGSSLIWDFEPVVAAPDPAATLLRFLLQGPVCIALVPLGQRLHLAWPCPCRRPAWRSCST